MPERLLSDLYRPSGRFMRSANLERDFTDPTAMESYVPTAFTRQCLEQVAEGLKSGSGQRAWRMTGDYGSGKSSFALLLAHCLAGHDSTLPPQLRKVIDVRKSEANGARYVPVLVTCARQPLSASILKSLHAALRSLYAKGARPKPVQEVQRWVESDRELSDEQLLQLLLEVNTCVIERGNSGLLLILDELGKYLEFAALHPERQDVYLLQRMAEAAARSGDEPFFVVSLLHQNFQEYADQLGQSAQREWEKVSGRFQEIVFNQPLEQVATLIASALNIRTSDIPKHCSASAQRAMEEALRLGWLGAASQKEWLRLATELFPLHPTVIPVLVRLLRRYGQNERSIFSFLLSNEPFGLQAFSTKPLKAAEPYRLHHLYDYVRTNFGHRLAAHSYRNHWTLIDSVVDSFATENELQIKILKTVGLLNLLNDGDLLPNEASVFCALADGERPVEKEIGKAIESLKKGKRVLYDRGRAAGLCLWPHMSVDLEKACEDARRALGSTKRVAHLIKNFLETRPIVARRHYIETGNLRYCDIHYCSVAELESVFRLSESNADGLIVIPLCETAKERELASEFARDRRLRDCPHWFVAVPQPLNNLSTLAQEFQRWDWISTNVLELNGDKFAREEVSRQKQVARVQLERAIQRFVGIKQFGETKLEWFRETCSLKISNGRELLEEISRVFDRLFDSAPKIHNELVNRHNLSAAAAAARMRLIERMFTDGSAPYLGMDPKKKPPEMSIYLSVLENARLHRNTGEKWTLGRPADVLDICRVGPALDQIESLLRNAPDGRLNVEELFKELRKKPYGIRDGLSPILLSVFALEHEQDVAFFKDGTFLRALTGEAMMVLTKVPDRFDIQYCKIEGVRAELFEKLLTVLDLQVSNRKRIELLDLVKPLCEFVAQLPAYVRNTKRLTPGALAVRDAILNARQPANLLFTDLPKACGFDPINPNQTTSNTVQAFVKALKRNIDELRTAFPELQERLRKQLREAFDLPGSFQQFRTALAERAEHVVLGVTEPKLKAFCLRLMDDLLAESEWLESLGSFLALKPPSKWHDTEENMFASELAPLAARFHRVESIVFANGKPLKNHVGIRLAITQKDGAEHEQVIHFTETEEQKLNELQTQFEMLLTKDRRIGLAAASRAIWASLDKNRTKKSE